MKKICQILMALILCAFFLEVWIHPVSAGEKEKYGGVFKIAYWKPAINFGNPLRIMGPDMFYSDFALQRLIQPGKKLGEFEPLLATSWVLAPDEKSYTFRLRKGVKFHDGTEFNAQAVKWNLDRVLTARLSPSGLPGKGGPPGKGVKKGGPPDKGGKKGGPPGKGGKKGGPPPGGFALGNVSSIDIVDEFTVRLNLSRWDNLILRDIMGSNSCRFVSPAATEKNGETWSNTNPVGTGPFKLKSYKNNVHSKYDRFDDYWEKGLPYLDGVEIHIIRDKMTYLASLKAGEVDALNEIDRVTAFELAKEDKYKISGIPGLRIFMVANANDPGSVWSDKRMREAIEYAIDKESIVRNLGRGQSKALYSIIPSVPGTPDTIPRKYDPGKARQLIRDAGHPEGLDCTLSFFAESPRDFWTAVQDHLGKVGIKVKLNPLTRPAFMGMMFSGVSGNGLRMGTMQDQPDPFLILESHISPKSALYKELKRPQKLIQLTDQIILERDVNEQAAMLREMEKVAYNNVSYIPLWTEPLMRAIDKNLKDYIAYFNGMNEFRVQNAWFAK